MHVHVQKACNVIIRYTDVLPVIIIELTYMCHSRLEKIGGQWKSSLELGYIDALSEALRVLRIIIVVMKVWLKNSV